MRSTVDPTNLYTGDILMRVRFMLLPIIAVVLAISACTPSAEVVERESAYRLLAAVGLPAEIECEEARDHPNPNLPDTWIFYCDQSEPSGDTEWMLVDVASTYRNAHTSATTTSTVMYQQENMVRIVKQTCDWVRSGDNWSTSRCTEPITTGFFPLG